jgi:hypothetical protein
MFTPMRAVKDRIDCTSAADHRYLLISCTIIRSALSNPAREITKRMQWYHGVACGSGGRHVANSRKAGDVKLPWWAT